MQSRALERGRPRKLIVTGDDFGLSRDVNEAIERSHRAGILSATSLMVGEAACADAVERARALPQLRVGLHVALVQGRPVLPASDIPDLVDARGEFSTQLVRAGFSFFFRPPVRRQLAAEIRAQFVAFAATGLALDHVDAHNHMHVHPTVFSLILRIGRDYGLRAVRIPYEPFWPSWRAGGDDIRGRFGNGVLLHPMLALMHARARRAGVIANDFVFGLSDTARMTSMRVMRLLRELPQGVTEMYFHPRLDTEAGRAELATLTDPAVASEVADLGIERTTFSELAPR